MDDDTQVVADVTPSAEDTATQATNDSASVQSEGTPEASQQTQGTADVTATDTVQEKLFAGKYKTVEDMEKAYNELNSKFTKTSQERVELSRILQDAFGDTAQAGATVLPNAPSYEDDDDTPTVPQPDTSVQRDLAIMKFMVTHEGVDAAALKEVLTNDPLVGSINGYDAKLEYANLRAKEVSQAKAIANAKQEAAKAAETKIIEKTAAQVESAAQSTPAEDADGDLWEQARGGDAAARRALLSKKFL